MNASHKNLLTNMDGLMIAADELRGHIRALENLSTAPVLLPAHQRQIKILASYAWLQAEQVSIYATKARRDRSRPRRSA